MEQITTNVLLTIAAVEPYLKGVQVEPVILLQEVGLIVVVLPVQKGLAPLFVLKLAEQNVMPVILAVLVMSVTQVVIVY